MKVLFCDPENTQNNFYIFTKFLRKKGIDASLVIESGSKVPEVHRPYWHDTWLKDPASSPEWLHYMEFPLFIPYRHPLDYIAKQRRLLNFVRDYDIIACSGFTPIWIRWARKPFIFFSFGADLDQLAVQGWAGIPSYTSTLREKRLVHFLIQRHLTGSLRKASAIVLSPYQIETATRLGLKNLRFLPHIIDTDLFKPMDYQERQQEKEKMREKLKCDLIFFNPSRQIWTDRAIADCKGNDKLFRAFAKFLFATRKQAKLVVIEKGWDLDASKKLVNELGITDHVVWTSPITKPEMRRFYNIADMVFDQFVLGVLALVSVESMACGTATFSYVAQAPKGLFYPEMPPMVNVNTEDEIFRGMCQFDENENMRNELGEKCQKWVRQYCHPDVAIDKYVELFEEVLRTTRKSKSRI